MNVRFIKEVIQQYNMEAKELRVGNYIYVSNPASGILEVRKQSVERCNYHHITDLCRNNKDWVYKPIPLTEKWLLKFGFEWKNHAMRLSNFYIRKQIGGFMLYISNETHNIAINIKYVHQLQNLYFALTGKELEI